MKKKNFISLNSIQRLFAKLSSKEEHELSFDAKEKFRDYIESLMVRLMKITLEEGDDYVRITRDDVKNAIKTFEKSFAETETQKSDQ